MNNTILKSFSAGETVLIASLTVAFFQPDKMYSFLLLAAWCALALWKLIANIPPVRSQWPFVKLRGVLAKLKISTENKPSDRKLMCFLGYQMGSRVLIYLYTIILVTYNLTQARFIATNFTTFVNGVSAVSVVYLFGKRSVKCSLMAMCNAWLLSLLAAALFPRIDNFWINMELHDWSFAAGYVLLYYLIVHRKWDTKSKLCFMFIVLNILVTFKRIGLAALALTMVVWLVLQYIPGQKTRRRVIFWGSVVAIALCYLFVLVVINGWLADFFKAAGIDPMGRNYYYAALAKYCDFSPWFIGLGRNASATLFATEFAKMRVGNVHSDILRMYAECGFLMFGVWLFIFWIAFPRSIGKHFGYRAMEFFVLCNIYTFVVYATDNTELYLINQYFYMLIPIWVSVYSQYRTEPLSLVPAWLDGCKSKLSALWNGTVWLPERKKGE